MKQKIPTHRTLKNGDQVWELNGKRHRLDGPAFIGAPPFIGRDGKQEWWVNGLRHRTDGPAYLGLTGAQEWFVNGKRHRLDGPAYIGRDGLEMWCVNGERIPPGLIEEWISEYELPPWQQWGDREKVLFALRFS